MSRIASVIKHPSQILRHFRAKKVFRMNLENLSDVDYLKALYKAYIGKELNLKHPRTFNEKIQWLKLYDRNPLYTQLVDKYKVRDFVSEKIGEEYLIPLIGVWDKPEDIDFSCLPDKFVLKCNHNSGMGMLICRNKGKIDKEQVIKDLQTGINQDYYKYCREWPYKNVPRRVICEQYIEDSQGGYSEQLTDYKLLCFSGQVKCLFVCVDRFSKTGMKLNFYDTEWNKLPFERHHPSTTRPIEPPHNLKKMIELAEVLSEGIPFVRVDFYESNRHIYFGEMTLYPGSGFEEFSPQKWDRILGDWLALPKSKIGEN